MARVQSTGAIKIKLEKKKGAVTYITDRENKVSKMFIISLGNGIELESTLQSRTVCTLEYTPLNQPITVHIVPERCNKSSSKSRVVLEQTGMNKSLSIVSTKELYLVLILNQ